MEIVTSLMLLFAGIGVLVLIHACVVGRTITRSGLFPDRTIRAPPPLGTTGMSRDDIDKLPCFDFEQLVGTTVSRSPGPDCAVCLESFKAGEKCRVLPLCNHWFHRDCVDTWLLRSPLCPTCRAGLKAAAV